MTYDYIAKIGADTSALDKKIKAAQGQMTQLSKDTVLIKIDYQNDNLEAVQDAIQELIKMDPRLTVQINYDMQHAALESELEKLTNMKQLKQVLELGLSGNDAGIDNYIDHIVSNINYGLEHGVDTKVLRRQLKEAWDVVESYSQTKNKEGFYLNIKEEMYDKLDEVSSKVGGLASYEADVHLFDKLDERMRKSSDIAKGLRLQLEDLVSRGAQDRNGDGPIPGTNGKNEGGGGGEGGSGTGRGGGKGGGGAGGTAEQMNEASEAMDAVAEKAEKLSGMDFGAAGAKSLADNLRDALSTLTSIITLITGSSDFSETLSDQRGLKDIIAESGIQNLFEKGEPISIPVKPDLTDLTTELQSIFDESTPTYVNLHINSQDFLDEIDNSLIDSNFVVNISPNVDNLRADIESALNDRGFDVDLTTKLNDVNTDYLAETINRHGGDIKDKLTWSVDYEDGILQAQKEGNELERNTVLANSFFDVLQLIQGSDVVSTLTDLLNVLRELSEAFKQVYGDAAMTNDELFESIQGQAASISKKRKFVGEAGDVANSVLARYKNYRARGGENSIEDIGASKALTAYLNANLDTEQSVLGIGSEGGALQSLAQQAIAAADAKERFATANMELLRSVVDSIAGIKNEGDAFSALNKLFNNLAKPKDTEALRSNVDTLRELIDVLNTNAGEGSFIKSLERMSAAGENLKALAQVIRATKKQIEGASSAVNGPGKDDAKQFSSIEETINGSTQLKRAYGAQLEDLRKAFDNFNPETDSIFELRRRIAELGDAVANSADKIKSDAKEIADGFKALGKETKSFFTYSSQGTNLEWIDEYILKYRELSDASERYAKQHGSLPNNIISAQGGFEKSIRQYIASRSGSLMSRIDSELNSASLTKDVRSNLQRLSKEMISAQKFSAEGGVLDINAAQRFVAVIEEARVAIAGLKNDESQLASTSDIDDRIGRINQTLAKYSVPSSIRGELEDLAVRLNRVRKNADDAADGMSAINKVELNRIDSQLNELMAEFEKTGRPGKFGFKFGEAITNQTAQFLARYFSLQDIIRYGRQAVQMVNAVDTSLKELQKVSSGTDQQMAQAFDTAAITAQNLGATITDVIDSTADWSRLGYNLPDAQELARVTTMYQNIAKGIDQKSASEYMVSTLQGFQLQASNAESIIDSINEVANNFAIDQAGIGEALQRSAASLYAAHTDLNKSIALVTTGNAILQNPESVGTAFKTLSARLRGAKNELEELGEDEAEVAATTSNLRQEVMALTGFDIMSDKDTYKDVYDILLGIGQAWGQLTDAQQAALAEKLAGKRMASVLYAVLNNTEQLEAAYATAMDSAGSAQRAQDIYASSVQFSIDRAKASLQELASDFLSSDLLKGIIDFGNGIIKMLDSVVEHIGFVGTALMGFGAGNAIKGLISPNGSFITNGVQNLWQSFVNRGTDRMLTRNISGLLASPAEGLGGAKIQKLLADTGSPERAVGILRGAGITDTAEQAEILKSSFKGIDDVAVKAAVGIENTKEALDGAQSSMAGVSKASLGLKGMLSSPIFWGAIAITTVIALIQRYNQNIAELRKRATEIADEWKTSTASMRENYQEVIKLRQELDAGGLSDAEQYRIKEQIYDIQKQIVEQYGEQADGINLVNGELATQLELLRNINKEEALRKYDENYDVFEQAQKDRIVVGDLADSNVLNLPGVSELVQSIAGLSVLDIDTSTIGDETIHLTTDIMDAHDAVNDYIVGLENLKEQYANNVEYQTMFDKAIEQANKYLHSHSAAWSDQIDTLNQMNSLIFAKEGGSVLFADFEEAAEAYNKALHMGDASEILETRDALTDAFDALTMFMKAKGLDANDFTDLFDSVVEGIDTTAEKAFNAVQEINEAMETIGFMNGGNVDLFNRPRVSAQVMRNAYPDYAGDYSTVHTATFSNAVGNVAANFTPIMTDDKGKFIGVLNAEQLQAYAEAVIDGVQTDTLNLQIGAFFEGEDAIARAEEAAERIHELQANVSWTNPTISNKDYRELGKYLQAVIDRGLDKVDVRSLLGKTSVRRSFEDQMSRIRLKDLSVALGFDISNEAELSAFIDLLYQSGVVAGDASDAIKESADAYNTLKTNVDKAIESVTKINAAMGESAAGTGISADSLKDLRDIYGDDLSYALETTAHGYHLNVTEMNKLQKKQESMVRSDFMGTLAEQYEKLDDANNHLIEAYQSGDFASAAQWSASISEINGEITKIQDLQMEWDAATSAYNRYLAAKSGTDEHSMYDTIQGGYKEVNDILAQGWTMSDDVVSYLKLVTGEEAKSVEDVERLWTSLGKTIEGTKFSINDFFTADDNGTTSDGIFNFFDTLYALQDKVGEHWVDIAEDGKYSFDFGFGGDQRVADMFSELTGVQIGVEAIQAIAQASRDIGFVDLSLEAPIASLEELKTEAEGAQQALVDLGDTSLSDINLNTTTFDETAAEIAKVQQYITDIEGSELTPEIKTERIEYANQVLEYLLRTEQGFSKELPLNVTVENLSSQIAEAEEAVAGLSKTKGKVKLTLDDATVQNLHMLYSMRETLSQPAIMSVDTSQIGGAMGNAIALIQQYESLASQLQVLKELSSQGIDVSAQTLEAEQKLQGVASQISALKSEDLQLVPGIDAESFQAQMAELSEYAVNLDTRLNEDKLAEIESQINNIKVNEIKVSAVVDDTEVVNLKSELRQMNGTTYTTRLGVEITNKASFIDIYNKWKEMKNGGGVNPSGRGGSSGSTNNGGLQHTTQLYGTAHTRGTAMSAFAHGNWGLEENQEALINELGPEIIVRDGQWFTVNSGYPTFASLKKGDVIFNHRQSEQILRNGRLTGSHAKMIGASHLEGTAFSSGGSASRKKLTTNSKSSSSSSGKSSGNGGNSAADKAAKEVKDWVEVRLERIAASLEKFKTMADYYVTFTYQNRELNKAIQQAKDNTAQNEAAYNKYIKKANSIKLSSNLKQLVREGDINLKSYDDKTQQLISEYSEWYSKAQECKNTIIELKKEQLDLSRQKLDNIIDDYEAVNNYLSATYDNWMKLNELAEKKQGVGNVEYLKNAAAYQNSTMKELRQAEKELTAEMNRQLKSGAMVKGSQEWEEAMTDIRDVQNAIKDAELEIYNLNEAIREVNWSGWNRIIARLEHYDSQLDTTIGLISDLTAYNKDASITDAGLSAMNMNALGLKYARLEIEDYTYAMETLRKELANGTINQEQFNEQLFDYAEKQMGAVEEAKKYREAIISLVKDGIDAETAAMEKLIDTRKEALEKQKEADDYAKKVNDQTKEINKIRAQIAALSGDTTLAAQAKVAKLRADLADKEADLEETRRDHTYDMMMQGYDDELEKFKEIQDEKIEALSYSLANQETVISNVLDETMDQYRTTAEMLNQIAMEYGIKLEDFIVDPWNKATSAAQVYKQAIAGLETSQNETGDTNIITAGAVNIRSEGTDITTGNMVNVSSATDTVKLKESITSPFYTGKKAAKGAKNARGLYLTDEQGLGSEALITKDGVLRQLDSDTVFSKKQTDVLWDLSKMPLNSMLNNASKIVRADTSVNMHYDSMLTVNGNVDRDALPGLQDLLKQACEYTKQDISATFSKMGLRGVL